MDNKMPAKGAIQSSDIFVPSMSAANATPGKSSAVTAAAAPQTMAGEIVG
jgi:hypothetical protein